ncbi:MAG TPA: phosphoribosylglycinamide formyltransferase [Burkholderiales bacterium]|nr:phosphoribosylglycinamide formyltransferase [Burkholderiales bacterium]
MKLVALISGRGSNLQAMLDAGIAVTAVLSNNPAAAGLALAQARGIPTGVVDHRSYASRAEFDRTMQDAIDAYAPDLVVLAGYMRILTDDFVHHYAGRLMNIHPSLLPSFPGLQTHAQALAEGVKIHGCTVHFVTPSLDRGPIVIQAAIPVLAQDTPETLQQRVLAAEHRIYPQAVRWFLEGRLHIDADGKVNLSAATTSEQSVLITGV